MLSDRCLSVCDVGVLWPKVGWIKMKVGTQVGLGPGHIVIDWDPAELLPPPNGGEAPPSFPRISVVAEWLDGSRCHLAGK